MKKTNKINLIKLLKPYTKDKLWVALYPDYSKVAGTGKDPKEAFENANKKVENPILIQAIPSYEGFVPNAS